MSFRASYILLWPSNLNVCSDLILCLANSRFALVTKFVITVIQYT